MLIEDDRDIWLVQTQSSAVSERDKATGHYPLWDEVTFIDRDPHWYSRRVKEAIGIRVHPDKINRDNVIKIQKHGCQGSNNTAAYQYQGGQFLV